MLERIDHILQHNCLVKSDKSILLGVSGGPDSLFLLDILRKIGYSLVIAHLDHGLRPESQVEAATLEQIAMFHDIPFTTKRVDVRVYGDTHSMSIEEAARTLRYRFLFNQARKYGVEAVAVGHTADDQVETVLMHLLRGSGLSGLGGMQYRALPNAWSQDIPLLRPILGVWRSEIETYIDEQGLNPLQDRTNLDVTYFRNRLRHKLIPYLEEYNPRIRFILWRTGDILRADDRLLERETDKVWEECVLDSGPGFVAFDIECLRGVHLALKRRIIRKGIAGLRPGIRDLDYQTIKRGIEFIRHPTKSNQIDLVSGLRLYLEGRRIYLAGYEADLPMDDWPQVPTDKQLPLEIPGKVLLGNAWMITIEAFDQVDVARHLALENDDPYQEWIDLSGFEGKLVVRSRRTGDRFKPLGLAGHTVSLSDFMINEKLPRRARDGWPVVSWKDFRTETEDGKGKEEIVWIPGFRIAHPFRITDDTHKAAYLKLERQKSD